MGDNGIVGPAPVRALGIGGSTRQASKSLVLPRAALGIAQGAVVDDLVQRRLQGMVAELLGLAVRLRQPATTLAGTRA